MRLSTNKTHILTLESFVKKTKLKFPAIVIRHCRTFSPRANVRYGLLEHWFIEIEVPTVTINYIKLKHFLPILCHNFNIKYNSQWLEDC